MVKDGKYVIYVGGVFFNLLFNCEGCVIVVKFGILGFFDVGVFKVLVDGSEIVIIYVVDFDYLCCKMVDDMFVVDDLLVGIYLLSGMFLNVCVVVGIYKKGDVFLIVNGQVKKWVIGENDCCYCDEECLIIVVVGDFICVVIK